jgi:hypothetical protein
MKPFKVSLKPVNFKRPLYIKSSVSFYTNTNRNSLNTNRSEKCFEHTLWRKMEHALYVQ